MGAVNLFEKVLKQVGLRLDPGPDRHLPPLMVECKVQTNILAFDGRPHVKESK